MKTNQDAPCKAPPATVSPATVSPATVSPATVSPASRRRELRFHKGLSIALGFGFWMVACSADDGSAPNSGGVPTASGGAASGGDGDIFNGDGVGASSAAGAPNDEGDDLPEEVEDEESFQAPVATGRYLWSANPDSGRVALIDVKNLSVRVLSAGLSPTYLAPVPGSDEPSALVLNVGSFDATRFWVEDKSVRSETIGTHTGANRWTVSEHWAIAHSAREAGQTLDPTEGLQEITVIALGDEMQATRLTVGYRPSHLQVSSDEEHLAVVSEEGITVIALTDPPETTAWIDLGFEAENRDVSVSDDGNYALVRFTDRSDVEIYDLRNPLDEPVYVTFSGHVTDLDLSASGRGAAVIRSKNQISTFLLEDLLDDPTAFDTLTIEGELFGSAVLTEDGNTAVLYTNAVQHDFINIVDLREGDDFLAHRALDTQGPVYSVTTSPDGDHGIVLAADANGRRGDAFAVVALRNERFPRVVGAQSTVSQVALADEFGIVTAFSESLGVNQALLVELPSLSVSKVDLSTEPLSAGVMADLGVAYAAQRHPEGRVTFFDLAADQARTLTGFELSAEVVDK